MNGAAHRSARRWRISRITLRVLAVNFLALATLVAGLLYHGQYQRGLIDAQLASLTIQADMVAAALGEGATAETAGSPELLSIPAREMVRRLAVTTRTRARLFAPDGVLIADSRVLLSPSGTIEIRELPPPNREEGTIAAPQVSTSKLYNALARFFSGTLEYALDQDTSSQRAQDYPGTIHALSGETSTSVQRARDGSLVLNVAVPVQRYKQVLGGLMLSKGSREIDLAMLEVRIGVLQVFAVALTITIGLSIYLASSIARPIRRLSAAAARVRNGLNRRYSIPDFAGRNDEIGDLARALRAMTEAIWLRMDGIERFAADVAHEIKNPLTSLRSAVETAARVTEPAQLRQLMDIIVADVKRLDRLISDISDASRLDAELSRAETEPVDIVAMLTTLADIYQTTGALRGNATGKGNGDRAAETAPVSIALELPEGVPIVVNALEGRLVQVFRNLIANAQSFSPPGGTIILRTYRKGNEAVVDVDDQGPGIPPGKEEEIFERFYSERPTGEAFGTHSGLGLSISRQIIHAHGGSLEARNCIGPDGSVVGARFTSRLPLA